MHPKIYESCGRFLLVVGPSAGVYSYCVIVKSVSCSCVCGSQIFSNPVTFSNLMFSLPSKFSATSCCECQATVTTV